MTDPARRQADIRKADPFHEGLQAARARKLRSLAIATGLILFVLLIFAISILKLAANAHLHMTPTIQ